MLSKTCELKDEKGRKGIVEGRFSYHPFFDSLSFNLKMHYRIGNAGAQYFKEGQWSVFFGKAVGYRQPLIFKWTTFE
jgi:hypothetical protein